MRVSPCWGDLSLHPHALKRSPAPRLGRAPYLSAWLMQGLLIAAAPPGATLLQGE